MMRRKAADSIAARTQLAEVAARRSQQAVWSLHHLTICWATLVTAGTALAVVALLVATAGAAVGVAIGTAVVGVFFTVSALTIATAGKRSPKAVVPVAVGTYIVKVLALGTLLVLIPRDGFVETRWMAAAVGLGVFCWLGAHMRYVWTSKLFYVDPS